MMHPPNCNARWHTRTAGLLPQRRHAAREAQVQRGVEAADVDAELQRIGGRHATQSALREGALDGAALRGRVA